MPPSPRIYRVTKDWCAEVSRRIKTMGISQRELARRAKLKGAKTSTATISMLLAGKQPTSETIPTINEIVGLPAPSESEPLVPDR
jgi:transcriptional regulator with XRE-family HTH domain